MRVENRNGSDRRHHKFRQHVKSRIKGCELYQKESQNPISVQMLDSLLQFALLHPLYLFKSFQKHTFQLNFRYTHTSMDWRRFIYLLPYSSTPITTQTFRKYHQIFSQKVYFRQNCLKNLSNICNKMLPLCAGIYNRGGHMKKYQLFCLNPEGSRVGPGAATRAF